MLNDEIPWFIPGPHLNLKAEFPKRAGGKERVGVSHALIQVGLEFRGTAHRGIDDARNIARLLPYWRALKTRGCRAGRELVGTGNRNLRRDCAFPGSVSSYRHRPSKDLQT